MTYWARQHIRVRGVSLPETASSLIVPLYTLPRSTIGDVLTRHGLSRRYIQDGPSGVSIR
jgi:hypothetical protein